MDEVLATGVKIYISISGNDNNPGTKDLPLASLDGAVHRLRNLKSSLSINSPVEIIVGAGEYFVTGPVILKPEDSGTETAPVVFKAEDGSRPVICGGIKISDFEKISETLWRAEIPEVAEYGWYFEQLYVNGRRATRARTPNSGFYFLKDVSETVINKGEGRAPKLAAQKLKLFDEGIGQIDLFSKEDFENAIITFYHKWDNTQKRIAGYEKDSSAIFTFGEGMKPWNSLNSKTRYVLENYKSALDTSGEWYLERSGYLYYMPKRGETIGDIEVTAPVTDKFIIFQGDEKSGNKVRNIRFEGLSFQVAGYKMPADGNEPAQAAHPVEAVIMADFAENIHFINCEITKTGTNAFWFRNACTDCRVEQSYLHNLGAGGVKIGNYIQPENKNHLTRGIIVNNNIIRSGGFVFPCAVGVILFHASESRITHNEIADFRYTGVSAGWVWGYSHSPSKSNTIDFNHIHHIGWGELCDMGGVYCLGASEGTTVSNNVIHNIYSFEYGGWGLYTDEGSTGIVMENNLVYNCKNSGFHQHYGKENVIRNNIFADNFKAQLQATRIEDHLSFSFTNNIVWFTRGDLFSSNWEKVRLHSDNNCYWDTRTKEIRFGKYSFIEWQNSGKDVHSLIADPQFVNPALIDFRIKNRAVIRKTGFKEFDYSRAGVYGTDEWKKLAVLDHTIVKLFDEAVLRNEKK